MIYALINGSPKAAGSGSAELIRRFRPMVPMRHECREIDMHNGRLSDDALRSLYECEAWVFFFPLYVDGIPSHLLSCLLSLEKRARRGTRVYAVINCGFIEGEQTETAMLLMENFCARAGLEWCGGIGIGGGGCLSMVKLIQHQQLPWMKIERALRRLCSAMCRRVMLPVMYTSIGLPKPFYKLGAEIMWRVDLMKNGSLPHKLKKRLKP